MNRIARRGLAVVASLALVGSAVACSGDGGDGSSGNVPGVTDTEILVGSHQPLTGPAAPGYSKIAPAAKAYFEHVNANGGVHGRKITYKYVDDAYNPNTTQQVVRELVLKDNVFAIINGLGTPTHSGVLEFLKSNNVPDLFVASGSRNWDQPDKFPGTFGFQTDYTVEGKILATYVKENFAGKKVCHIGQDDDFGRDSLLGVEMILGDTLASKQTYVPTNTNVRPQVGELKGAGCEVVISATVPGFTAAVLGAAAAIGGFKPQWVVSSVGGDFITLSGRLGKEGTPLLEGMISGAYLPDSQDTSNPWTAKFREIYSKALPNETFDGNTMYGMTMAYMFVQALQAAGEDLTREGIIEAVEKGGFKNSALTPYRYSATDHSGMSGMQLAKVSGGKQAPFTPVYVTDEADAPVTEYTEPQAPPPANGIPTAP